MVRHLFRMFAFLLAVMLPLRLMAAGIVPIVGMPGHAHFPDEPAQTASAALQGLSASAHEGCAAHAASAEAPADGLHEHGCPQLGMTGMSPPAVPRALEHKPPRVGTHVVATFDSVVLDVPSPPPTARL